MKLKYILGVLCCTSLVNCSSANLVVDPASIKDPDKYVQDMKDCENISKQYDLTADVTRGAVVGAGVGIGGVAAILATGGLYLLPAGIALAGGGGGGYRSRNEQIERKAGTRNYSGSLPDRPRL